MIPNSFIQHLLDRVDIIELIAQSVKLTKAGVNHKALCPFHNEKSPSFTANASKQFYHCFGCGAHGTAIDFVMNTRNLGFVDAINELAQSQGLTVPENKNSPPPKNFDELYQCLEAATSIFENELARHSPSRDYLEKRNISADTIKRFRIGYAPGGFAYQSTELRQLLADAGFTDESILIRTGLLLQKDSGSTIERFRNRLIVPIINRKGRVIGFGGRTLGNSEPKYLNSPETEVFHKGREWFGLPQAIEAMRKEDLAIVVEGYFDAIALSQAGILPVIASMGTAMTNEQIAVIWGACSEMVLCFDGDLAGVKAVWRVIDRLLPSLQDGKTVKIVNIPKGQDPDDYIKEHGCEAMRKILMSGRTLSEILLEELKGGFDGTSESKAGLVRNSAKWLSAISKERAPIIYHDLLKQISTLIELPIESIMQSLPITQNTHTNKRRFNNFHSQLKPLRQRKSAQLERWGLMEALSKPEAIHEILAGSVNADSDYTKCLQWLADRYDAGELPELWAAKIEWLAREGFAEVIAELMGSMARDEHQEPKEEDMKFRRSQSGKATGRRAKLERFNLLCAKQKNGTLSDEERVEVNQIIKLLPTLQLHD